MYLTIDQEDNLFVNIDSKSIVKKDQEIIIDITYDNNILSHTVKNLSLLNWIKPVSKTARH